MAKQREAGFVARIIKFTNSCKKQMVFSVIFAAIGVIAGILPFIAASKIVTALFEGVTDTGFYLIWGLGVAGGGALVKIAFMLFSTALSHFTAFKVLEEIRIRVAGKLTRVPMGYISEMSAGRLKKTVIDDVEKMETPIAHMVPEIFGNLMGVIAVAVLLLINDWRTGLAALISLPLGTMFFMGVMKDYKVKWARYTKAAGNMNSTVVEYVNGIEVIKAFGQSASSYAKYSDAVMENNAATTEWMASSRWWMAAAHSIWPAVLLFVLPTGLALFGAGTLPAAKLIMGVILALCLTGPVISVINYTDQLAEASTVLGNVEGLLEYPEMRRPEENAVLDGDSIAFKNVSFAYSKKEVLHDVSFNAEKGKITALVGPSGGGKSTIAKLLAGYWDISSGEINVFGVKSTEIPFKQLNEYISYVAQDNFLFDMSIKDNIKMGKPDADNEEIIAAAKAANCHDFIVKLEKGYDTLAGDAGAFLSGGERQRITIARALLKNSPIVILDEATSYADIENEAEIQKAISALAKNKTLIVIAHRLNTIVNSDKIVVLDSGCKSAEGTHAQLLKSSAVYKNMWESFVKTSEAL